LRILDLKWEQVSDLVRARGHRHVEVPRRLDVRRDPPPLGSGPRDDRRKEPGIEAAPGGGRLAGVGEVHREEIGTTGLDHRPFRLDVRLGAHDDIGPVGEPFQRQIAHDGRVPVSGEGVVQRDRMPTASREPAVGEHDVDAARSVEAILDLGREGADVVRLDVEDAVTRVACTRAHTSQGPSTFWLCASPKGGTT
jgi:hypothetical protein